MALPIKEQSVIPGAHLGGPLAISIGIPGQAELYSVTLIFSAVPLSENAAAELFNDGGSTIAYAEWDPSVDAVSKVTRCFMRWATDSRGGTLSITHANTSGSLIGYTVNLRYS
jgi:hypothetical protein